MERASAQWQRGFTLIEIMFILVILGIVYSSALPSMRTAMLSTQSRSARDLLMNSLNLARTSAVTTGNDVVICPSSDGQTCNGTASWQSGWIIFGDTNRNDQRDGDETLISVGQRQPAGQAILSTAGRTHVTYHPDGSSPGTNVTISFCDGRGVSLASAIIISNAGRARTGQPSIADATAACATLPPS